MIFFSLFGQATNKSADAGEKEDSDDVETVLLLLPRGTDGEKRSGRGARKGKLSLPSSSPLNQPPPWARLEKWEGVLLSWSGGAGKREDRKGGLGRKSCNLIKLHGVRGPE